MNKTILIHKLNNLKFNIRHNLFVFERKWQCHPFFSRFYPKKTIYRRSIAVFLALIIISSSVLIFFQPEQTEAAWWDDSYAYRQKFSFIHSTSLTNASMRLTFDTSSLITAGKMQVDCDDSRFTDINGKVLKYRLISGCNSGSTIYDVIFPTITGSVKLYYYFYYGNASAFSASDNSVPAGTTPTLTFYTGSEEKGLAPVVYYSFDEGYGTIANSTGSCATCSGTLTNMASPPASTSGWMDSGKLNKALNFDGLNDSLTMSNVLNMGTSDFSISAWVKSTSTAGGNNNGIVFKRSTSGTTNAGYQLNMPNGSFYFTIADGANSQNLIAGSAYNDGNWHHVVAVAQRGNEMRIYIDGILKNSVSETTVGNIDSTTNLTIGGLAVAIVYHPFKGAIDEPRIYNYALSDAQVKSDFNRNASAVMGQDTSKSSLFDGLVGYWKLDDGVNNPCVYGVDKACDSSGLNQTGTWTNGAASTSGKFANGVIFDGANDSVDMGNPSSGVLDFGLTSFSYGAWVNITGISGGTDWQLPVYKGGNSAPVAGYSLEYAEISNDWRCNLGDGSQTSYPHWTPSFSYNTGWHHIFCVVDRASQTAKLYFDGVQQGNILDLTAAGIDSVNTSESFILSNISHPLQGKIDDVRVYNRALSGSEIAKLYDWAPEPVGWWKLDERSGTVAKDSSGNNNTSSTFTGDVSWRPGKYGSGLYFDGADYVVRVPETTYTDVGAITDSYTVSAWIKTSAKYSDDATIVAKTDGNGSYPFRLRLDPSGYACFTLSANNGSTACGTTALNDGKWHYITGKRDIATDSVYIYVDGIQINSGIDNSIGSAANNDDISIGNSGTSYTEWDFSGTIDDVRIYNYARSAKQIVSDMNAGHPAVGSPIGSALGHWKFDEGYGTTANNSGSGGSGLNGTLTSMDSPATYGSGWTNNGKFGKALNFDGLNDVIMVPYNTAADITEDITLSAWIKKSANGVGHDILTKGLDNNSVWNYGLFINSSNALVLYSNNTTPVSITSNSTITGKEWHHILATRNGSTVNLYIDGKLDKTGTMTGSFGSNSYNIHIGKGGDTTSGSSVNGALDEVKIYNYALSSDEVKTEFNQGKSLVLGALSTNPDGSATNSAERAYCPPGNAETNCAAGLNPAPIGEWKMDERRGLTARDTSGNANDGTLTNGPVWTTGKVGQGIKFDGIDDYLDIISPNMTGIETFTYSFWARQDGTGTSEENRTGKLQGSAYFFMDEDVISRHFRVAHWDGSTYPNINCPNGTVANNQWNHFTAVYVLNGASSDITLYQNGVQCASGSINKIVWTGVGATMLGQSDDLGRWNGAVDDFRVYNYARTPAQVAWDYNRGGPVGHWKFDECQGATAYDSSGTRNNGTIVPGAAPNTSVGTCSSGDDTEMWNDGTNGKYSSSLGFDGTNDYVDMGDPASGILDAGAGQDMSWSYWIKTTENSGATPIGKWDGSFDEDAYYSIINFVPGKAGCYLNDSAGAGTEVGVDSEITVTDNNWHSVTCVKSGTTLNIYTDGVLQNSTSNAIVDDDLSNTTNFKVDVFSQIDGQIDDVRVYRYALSPTQVRLLYNENSAVRFGPLTGSP